MTVGTAPLSRSQLRAAAAPSYFHVGAAAVMLTLTIAGFYPYYLRGVGAGGRIIDPTLKTLVLAHGACATAWFVLFLVQTALIPAGRRRVHMRLGWATAVVAIGVAVSGAVLAVESARLTPDLPFLGIAYREFLMVMLAEMAVFAALVGAGVYWRRRPERHRAMMLLASLSILAGATFRMPVFHPLFGTTGWEALFGPAFALGLILAALRGMITARFERWLIGGLAAMAAAYVLTWTVAVTPAGRGLLRAVFGF